MEKTEIHQSASQKQHPHPVIITDAAAMTALGSYPGELWAGLLAGKTAIRPFGRFGADNTDAKIAAWIEDLKPAGGRSMISTLLDRLLYNQRAIPPDALLITATAKAGIDNLELLRRGYPADSRDILLSSVSKIISQKLGLMGKGINISAACASSTVAVARGAAWIASGRVDAVLVCCADIVTAFVLSGFSALKALSPVPCMPFDQNRSGLSLGEGAAVLLMMSKKRAERENRHSIGRILGWGVSNDATHITAPAKNGCGLVQAISQALKKAKRKPEEIAAIHAHGTGTLYNDLMELVAFRQVFEGRKVPIYSVKGAIGHTLGAAGGIETVLSLNTLQTRVIPPTVGCSRPEAGAEGQVSSESKPIFGSYLLTTNSGFGGVNAALILGK